MNRDQMRALAQETLEISRAGQFQMGNQIIPLPAGRPTELFLSEDLDQLVQNTAIPQDGPAAAIEVRNEGTVDAIFRMAGQETRRPELGVLNFASAKNPGGGFLNGAVAQEECLAFCSNLYLTQTSGQGPKYYEINRAFPDPTYTDTMLISDVAFFRDSRYALSQHRVLCPVLTAPAVNMGVVRNGKGPLHSLLTMNRVPAAKEIMKGRMRKILALFAHWNCTQLILGAYGCGVFRNDPEDVARFWQELLAGEGWGRLFSRITFSILERPEKERNILPFRQMFGE